MKKEKKQKIDQYFEMKSLVNAQDYLKSEPFFIVDLFLGKKWLMV